MKKYWALDYVNGELGECELVYGDKLYATEEEAYAACEATGRPELFDITWYSVADLEDAYGTNDIEIDEQLRVHASYS